jgi:arylsulfatase A-like enzyme
MHSTHPYWTALAAALLVALAGCSRKEPPAAEAPAPASVATGSAHAEAESHLPVGIDWFEGDVDAAFAAAKAASKPLFLYLTFSAPHTPYQAPEEYLARYPEITDPLRKAYAGQITAMDAEIGKVVAALDRKGMRENTLIVFSSDNGGTRSALFVGEGKVTGEIPPDNGPFRDGSPEPRGVFCGITDLECHPAAVCNAPGHAAVRH